MIKIIIYAFENFRHISKLHELGLEHLVIVKKIKDDMNKIYKIIQEYNISHIIGFGNGYRTIQETQAINDFNGKKINIDGLEKHYLHLISDSINHSIGSTNSFCNYTAFCASEYIHCNNLDIKNSFVHIRKSDNKKFDQMLTELKNLIN